MVVGATPKQMEDDGFRPVGRGFPVFIHPRSHEEYALARTERKTGRGYKGFTFYAAPDVTLEQDLARRDLTLNAIAQDCQGGLIDPYGGEQDLRDRLLRHVSNAFAEDPLRVVRIARFAAALQPFGFRVHPETMELMQAMVKSGEIADLVPERVWMETAKALATTAPRRYFEVLRECGALGVIFPEIDCLFGVPQNPRYHPEIDTGLHTLLSLDRICEMSDSPEVRFATLVHDLGKGATPKDEWPAHRGHEERGVRLIEKLCERLRIPNTHRQLAVLVSRWHLHAHRAMELKPATLERLLGSLDCWRQPQRLQQFLLCCCADARGRTGLEESAYAALHYLPACLRAGQEVDINALLERKLDGVELGKAIQQARIEAISAVREGYELPS